MAEAIGLVVVKMQALAVVSAEAEGDERAMNEPWIGVEEERLVEEVRKDGVEKLNKQRLEEEQKIEQEQNKQQGA